MVARRAVEQRLQEAENSLARLERALKGERSIGQSEECVKQQMIGDVTTLKSMSLCFFYQVIKSLSLCQCFINTMLFLISSYSRYVTNPLFLSGQHN